ncbi:MAG: hypothetical protein IPJ74_13125 [Saprospiraceae bacterium]|nr:hypothetical protein [Saprospiraceae bacterium]
MLRVNALGSASHILDAIARMIIISIKAYTIVFPFNFILSFSKANRRQVYPPERV